MALLMALVSCHSIDEYDNDKQGNFDALWTIVDQHYCFFDHKGIDWDSVGRVYRPQALEARSNREFFDVCARMLDELRDGHVNLSSWFETSYYRKWWSDYPQNYDQRLVQQHYLDFDYKSLGPCDYALLCDSTVGYLRVATFDSGLGPSNLDAVLDYFRDCNGLIIDVRDNTGGKLTNVESLVSRFLPGPVTAGYMIHKTGPGHNDFSKPFAFTYSPSHLRVNWPADKPVAVLMNRTTFSAANNFVGIMQTLDNVTLVGDVTGGGSGMPLSSELPVGWTIRLSACRILDPAGRDTEWGIPPSEGYKIDLDPEMALQGIDTMLECAIKAVQSPQ